jgi:CHAD domain-containing protein
MKQRQRLPCRSGVPRGDHDPMAYRLKLDEGIQAGIRRIGLEEIDRASQSLATPQQSDGKSTPVHEARKSLKRIRALLRLVRPSLGERVFQRENADFRETAALLSHTRDTEILIETTLKLDARFAQAPHASLKKLHRLLAEQLVEVDPTAEAAARTEAIARLERARPRLARLKIAPDDFTSIQRGLERSVRRARSAFHRAYAEPSDEAFHDLRKGVQQQWRHMALLRRAWPGLADARLSAARTLSQTLGDDHDLSILVLRLDTLPDGTIRKRDRATIAKLAARRQSELRILSRPHCERLFADRAGSLARRFAVYWAAASDIKDGKAEDDDGHPKA